MRSKLFKVTLLQFEVYLYNDEIIREGTIGRKMFFISCGTVRIVNSKTQAHTLTDGAFFWRKFAHFTES